MGRVIKYSEISEYINNAGCELATTTEEFNALEGNNTSKLLKIKCGMCGSYFYRSFTNFKSRKNMCEECSRKYINSSFQKSIGIIKEYLEFNNIKTKLLSTTYKNNRERLLWKCECGEEFYRNWSNFKAKKHKGCNKCSNRPKSGRKKWTENALKEYIESIGLKFISCDKNGGYDSKITIQCECGENYTVRFHNFINSNQIRCSKCLRKEGIVTLYTIEDINKYILNNNIDVKLLSTEYNNCKENLKFECKCGEIFETNLDCFMNSDKIKCNNCSIKIRSELNKLSPDEVENDFFKLNPNIKIMGDYINSITPILLQCEHGHIFTKSYNNFKRNPTCVVCNESKSEQEIRKILSNKNINFEKEYYFDDLLGDFDNLRFDFAVFDDFNNLKFLIESDGRQHFESIDYFGGDDGFEKRKRYDYMKNQYCKDNSLKLYRIPYWQFDKIEQLITNILKNNNV